MEIFLKGLVMGFCIAAPVGPIGLLCIRRSIAEGQLAGFVSGLGAATADALYGMIAALGLTAITLFLLEHRSSLQIFGGLFLAYVGVRMIWAKRRVAISGTAPAPSLRAAYASTVALTLANPATILSFVGIFAGLGIGSGVSGFTPGVVLVGGVFLGSACWWLVLSAAANWLGAKFHPDRLHVLNVISGSLIVAFGAWQAGSALLTRI